MPYSRSFLGFVAVGALFLASCDSAEPVPDPIPLETQLVTDLPADPVVAPPGGGRPRSTGRFTLFSLSENRIVLSSFETDAATRARDSVSSAWDIGFSATTIIFNGGISGPGRARAQLLMEAFANVLEAPAGGYLADGENTCPAPGRPLAICTGSGNGWFNYDPQTRIITPIPGRTIVLRTAAAEHYAKIRILSYYRGNPVVPDASTPARHYTFEYIYQPDGSRNFRTTTPR